MDRRKFIRRIGLVSAGVIIAPVVASEALKEMPAIVCDKRGPMAFIKNGVTYSFNTPENVIEFWRLTGTLVVNPSKEQVFLLTEKGNIEIQKITKS